LCRDRIYPAQQNSYTKGQAEACPYNVLVDCLTKMFNKDEFTFNQKQAVRFLQNFAKNESLVSF
jgi:hypothetical protein